MQTHYSTGTASVANGDTTITFSGALLGTQQEPNFRPGDLFADPAQPLVPGQRLDSVDYGAGTAELWVGWPGTTMTADPYEVRFVGDNIRHTAQTRRFLEMLGQLAALGIQPNAFGDEPGDRDAYDDAAAGFIYLDVGTPWTLYIKLSAANADWDAGQVVRGPVGATGPIDSSNNTVTDIVRITQAAYDVLDPPSTTTLYIMTEE